MWNHPEVVSFWGGGFTIKGRVCPPIYGPGNVPRGGFACIPYFHATSVKPTDKDHDKCQHVVTLNN